MISNDSREKIRGVGLLAEHIICMAVSYEEPIEKFRNNPLYSPQFEDKESIARDIAETGERITQEIKAVSTTDLKLLNDEHGISLLEYIDMLNEAIKETPYNNDKVKCRADAVVSIVLDITHRDMREDSVYKKIAKGEIHENV